MYAGVCGNWGLKFGACVHGRAESPYETVGTGKCVDSSDRRPNTCHAISGYETLARCQKMCDTLKGCVAFAHTPTQGSHPECWVYGAGLTRGGYCFNFLSGVCGVQSTKYDLAVCPLVRLPCPLALACAHTLSPSLYLPPCTLGCMFGARPRCAWSHAP